MAPQQPRQAIDHGIAYVPEDRIQLGLVLDQPIGSNIVLTILDQASRRFGLIRASRAEAADRWISDLAIKVSDPENAGEDAFGRQPAARGARQMDGDQPGVLILDSPTVGVDISAKDGIYERQAVAAEGIAIILISTKSPRCCTIPTAC